MDQVKKLILAMGSMNNLAGTCYKTYWSNVVGLVVTCIGVYLVYPLIVCCLMWRIQVFPHEIGINYPDSRKIPLQIFTIQNNQSNTKLISQSQICTKSLSKGNKKPQGHGECLSEKVNALAVLS